MPITLTTPVSTTLNKTTVQILSFSIDLVNNLLSITYAEGDIDGGGNFVMIDGTKQLDISGADFAAVVAANPQLYADLKAALYSELQTRLGISGTVS